MEPNKLQTTELLPTGKTHSATVIFFHGLGDSGDNLVEWIRFLLCRDLRFQHIKMVFPTAPRQAVTTFRGAKSNVWYDLYGPYMDMPEHKKSFAQMYTQIEDLIQNEIQLGIPINRILIGGYSMGSNIALHVAYHLYPNVAGVFALSTYLNYDSVVFETLAGFASKQLPQLLVIHGDKDDLIPYKWGQITFKELTRFGVKGEFITMKNVKHELQTNQLLYVEKWIKEILPPLPTDMVHKL